MHIAGGLENVCMEKSWNLLDGCPYGTPEQRSKKNGIVSVGSIITDEAVKRVRKCIGCTVEILNNFDAINGIKEPSGTHSKLSKTLEMKVILRQLHKEGSVFGEVTVRAHRNFPRFELNPICFLIIPQLTQWMGEKLQKLVTFTMHAYDPWFS